jgi:hypothetical protein
MTPPTLLSAVARKARGLGFWLHCPPGWWEVEMADGKGAARAVVTSGTDHRVAADT